MLTYSRKVVFNVDWPLVCLAEVATKVTNLSITLKEFSVNVGVKSVNVKKTLKNTVIFVAIVTVLFTFVIEPILTAVIALSIWVTIKFVTSSFNADGSDVF